MTSTSLPQRVSDGSARCFTIRAFEDRVQEMFGQRLVPGTTYVCQDQEASCVGAVSALEPTDILSITYRGHGQANKEGEP